MIKNKINLQHWRVYALILFSLFLTLEAQAQAFTYEGINYSVISSTRKTVAVESNIDLTGKVVIPSSVTYDGKEYTVVEISKGAFAYARITSITMPDGLESIGGNALRSCTNLTKIVVPNSVTTIGDDSFYDCSNVTSIVYGKKVKSIGSSNFSGLSSLKSVISLNTTPPSVDEWNSKTPVTLYVPKSSISAYSSAPFWSYYSVYSQILDVETYTPVADSPFGSLKCLTIGNRIEEIESNIFNNCCELTTVVFGNSLKEIGENTFSGCEKLTDLNFASSAVQTIGDGSFSGCTSLEEVILPPSVETIGASAFAGDSRLEKIIMGHKVKSIGEKAFDGCQAGTVSITAQTPPTAPNNTFSNYRGKLYVQGEKAKDAYYDAFTCWDRFDSYVMIEAEEIKISGPDKISGKAGDTFQLTATVWPENVTLPQIFWRATNPEIATVYENGLVTLHVDLESLKTRAQGEGDIDGACTIIAETLYNDGPVAQIGVTAEEAGPVLAESLTIDPKEWSGIEGSEFTIKATVLPENAENKTVTFESSNTSIATVDAEGNVKVLKEGTCVITVSTVDGSNLKAECFITGLSGVEAIFADPNASVDVYDMNGILLKKACSRDELKQLKPAVYILRSADTVVKAVVNY
ncbi:MAG: leucine-rich repeat protein [Muribaculaceae bacterium]|nr:leucine-rich repeat protein [Muribaculaceae bacterium]